MQPSLLWIWRLALYPETNLTIHEIGYWLKGINNDYREIKGEQKRIFFEKMAVKSIESAILEYNNKSWD